MYDHGLFLGALLLLNCPLGQIFGPVVIVDVIDELVEGDCADVSGAVSVALGAGLQGKVLWLETTTKQNNKIR